MLGSSPASSSPLRRAVRSGPPLYRSLTPSDSEYRLGGRPRTVFGCLVARRGPVRQAGLTAWWLPGVSWGVGFPWCDLGVGGFPGSRLGWPHCVRWGGAVPVRAAPGPVQGQWTPTPAQLDELEGALIRLLSTSYEFLPEMNLDDAPRPALELGDLRSIGHSPVFKISEIVGMLRLRWHCPADDAVPLSIAVIDARPLRTSPGTLGIIAITKIADRIRIRIRVGFGGSSE